MLPNHVATSGRAVPGTADVLLAVTALAGSMAGFLVFCRLVGTQWPFAWLLISAGVTLAGLYGYRRGMERAGMTATPVSVRLILTMAVGAIALSSVYHLACYMRIPADILSFAESPFVNEIIKARAGMPPFLDPLDNNSMPYTPGAPLLTGALASLFGYPDSIPALRFVQFGFVLLAALVAAHFCHLLARQLLNAEEYTHRPLWFLLWTFILLLVATEENINQYTFTLHNDGLALLVSMFGFWLIARDSMRRSLPVTLAMLLLPAVGFMFKQNLLMWLGLFAIYRFVSGHYSWKQQLLQLALTCMICALLIGGLYLAWGDNFVQWVFVSLGIKETSILRIVLHLFAAGIYLGLGLAATWVFLLAGPAVRPFLPVWICWVTMFCLELYTSGVAWPPTHLGPGILAATALFLVALVRLWPRPAPGGADARYFARQAVIAIAMIGILGAGGHVRPPLDPVPDGVGRQIAAIEDEFRGMDPTRVLMDDGSWIYLRDGVVMRDRSTPVAMRVGKNQPEIDHALLAGTLARINSRYYDKIIARHLGGSGWSTWYDFQDRGSGVKDAILENYHELKRIPAVTGIQNRYWMQGLTGEVRVFVPNADAPATAGP